MVSLLKFIYRIVVPRKVRQYVRSGLIDLQTGEPIPAVALSESISKAYYTFDKVTRLGTLTKNYVVKSSQKITVPVALLSKRGTGTVEIIGRKYRQRLLLPSYHWHYLNINPDHVHEVQCSSDKGIFGEPIYHLEPVQKKIVIVLVVDALGKDFLDECGYEESMPNTDHFMSRCRNFDNAWSSSEWTLPCVASMSTGLYVTNHGIWKNSRRSEQPDVKNIHELFESAGYLTSYFSSVSSVSNLTLTRHTNLYPKGVQHYYSADHARHEEITFNVLEYLRAYPNENHFVYIHYMDVHHIIGGVPSIGSQIRTEPTDLDVSQSMIEKTEESLNKALPGQKLRNRKSDSKMRRRKNEVLRELDFHLESIYRYVENLFDQENITTILTSDHGQIVVDNKELLSKDRCNITLKVKSMKLEEGDDHTLVSAVDLVRNITSLADIPDPDQNKRNGVKWLSLGGSERQQVRIESVSPNSDLYELCLRDNKFVYYSKTKVVNTNLYRESTEDKLYLVEQFDNQEMTDIRTAYSDVFKSYKNISSDILDDIECNKHLWK